MENVESALKGLENLRDRFFLSHPPATLEDRQRVVNEGALRLLHEVPTPTPGLLYYDRSLVRHTSSFVCNLYVSALRPFLSVRGTNERTCYIFSRIEAHGTGHWLALHQISWTKKQFRISGYLPLLRLSVIIHCCKKRKSFALRAIYLKFSVIKIPNRCTIFACGAHLFWKLFIFAIELHY